MKLFSNNPFRSLSSDERRQLTWIVVAFVILLVAAIGADERVQRQMREATPMFADEVEERLTDCQLQGAVGYQLTYRSSDHALIEVKCLPTF